MDRPLGRSTSVRLLIAVALAVAALAILVSNRQPSPTFASARSTAVFGPACGAPTIDGVVDPVEWSGASTQTFQMVGGSGTPFTATLYVMNGGYYLYMGITINDDEFTPLGQYLPTGDTFRIDFDNDHSGSLFAMGDDVLIVSAGLSQFEDEYLYNLPHAAQPDVLGGGTPDGAGAASRVGGLNHFELRHPLCSGDSLDFCLHPTDIVGFRLEYLDAEADGSFGGSQFFPGVSATADIVVGQCSVADFFVYLPVAHR